MSALKAFRGKNILVVEDGSFLKNDVRAMFVAAGGRIVGPTAMAEDLIYYLRGDIDGAIVDVELPQETVLYISEVLEARAIPFVFAANASPMRDVPSFGGFLLVADTIQLNKIAAALFDNTSPKTRH
ncbi:hypothetical protein JNB91_28235 [Rhizobium wenxiniae]|uniref:hypothetical protein n=1 Tax=Rhizobium wenxiniae TaxID=1737357 RepID=UPI001C6E0DCC|nr:hypothetical protein [Rhizobium wenxiniae]MBW9091685.1 hypothetical protein [Rhizobium wenxiniae]